MLSKYSARTLSLLLWTLATLLVLLLAIAAAIDDDCDDRRVVTIHMLLTGCPAPPLHRDHQ